jgi:hypothetical protein
MTLCYDAVMRTTLDIDPRAMAAARAKAAADRTSLGRAVSELVLEALAPAGPTPAASDFPVFDSVPGHVITNGLVAEFRDKP